MKITVLSGSPKGEWSISLQYLKYMAKFNKEVNFDIFHIGEKIHLIENNKSEYDKIIESIKSSDAVLWVFPVYHMLVPAQLKRFIELINENNSENIFNEKYSSSIITSIHFYDNLTEDYIRAVSEDLGMKYIKGFLAEMEELEKEGGQKLLLEYGKRVLETIKEKRNTTKYFKKTEGKVSEYIPEKIIENKKSNKYKILLITDRSSEKGNLKNMIETFVKKIENDVEIVNLDKIKVNGGCLGCCKCGYNSTCVYKDEMSEFLKGKFLDSDAVVVAAEIKDRYMSASIKRMWDRSFMFGHKSINKWKSIVYILSGKLSGNNILKNEIEIRASIGKKYLVDVVSDEYLSGEELTLKIEQAGKDLVESVKNNFEASKDFYYVASHKIFRDFVYGMKYVFKSDHDYYKKIKYYDFPQKNTKQRIFNFLILQLLKSKKIREEFQKRTKFEIVKKIKMIAEKKL